MKLKLFFIFSYAFFNNCICMNLQNDNTNKNMNLQSNNTSETIKDLVNQYLQSVEATKNIIDEQAKIARTKELKYYFKQDLHRILLNNELDKIIAAKQQKTNKCFACLER